MEGREAPAYFRAPTSFLLGLGWWVVRLSVNVKVPLTGKNSNYVFSCRKRRLGLETYLERTMVDSTVDRSTESADGICRSTESADGICKPMGSADGIYRPTESTDGICGSTAGHACVVAAGLLYLRTTGHDVPTRGCCTCVRTAECRTCAAGLLYLRTRVGCRTGARGVPYRCAHVVPYRCARGRWGR